MLGGSFEITELGWRKEGELTYLVRRLIVLP